MKFFGVTPEIREHDALKKVPWNAEALLTLSETHILVAIPPLSILDMRTISDKRYRNQHLFYPQDDYDKKPFARDEGEIGWQLIRRTPVEGSFGKTWNYQQWLLGVTEELPCTQVLVYAMVGHFLNTGERLFEKDTVRTADICVDKRRVYVGNFKKGEGLDINFYPDDKFDQTLGLAAMQRTRTLPPQPRTSKRT